MADLTARRLCNDIEAVRSDLAALRDHIEDLDRRSNEALLPNGKALEAAAGGITCVIATLAAGQEELRRA